MWPVTLSLLLMSVIHWDNYVSRDSIMGSFSDFLLNQKRKIHCSRTKLTLLASVWKLILTTILGMMWTLLFNDFSLGELFGNKCESKDHVITLDLSQSNNLDLEFDWVSVWAIHAFVSWAVFEIARIACKTHVQFSSFALPLTLSPPLTFALLLTGCELWNHDPLQFKSAIPSYLFYDCYNSIGGLSHLLIDDHIWMAAIWWISIIILTKHIWSPHIERLASTEKIFIRPFYSNVLLDTSLTMNRRRDDTEVSRQERIVS